MILLISFFSLLVFISSTPNAIHALLALILLFINFSILLFSINSIFLGFAYILVYIGAICVLFLYIILLLHLRTYSLMNRVNSFFMIGINLIFILIMVYSNTNLESFFNINEKYNVFYLTDLQLFTSYLVTSHFHYLLLGIFLLLLALFFAIFLSTRFLKGKEMYIKNITNA